MAKKTAYEKARKVRLAEGKRLLRRAKATRGLLTAAGVLPGKSQRAGAGRPKGSYKYKIAGRPVDVFTYKRFLAQRKAQLQQFQRQQNQRLATKGFTPEQAQLLRQRQVIEQARRGGPVMQESVAEQEVDFQEHLAKTTVSPNTQRLMNNLRRTQLKARSDNIEQQRRHHERRLLSQQGNLMKAHENMVPVKLDFTGVSEDNILSAGNIFRENPEDHILRMRRRSILDTQENTLRF